MAHLKTPSSSTSSSPNHPSNLTIGAHIERNSSANVSLALSGLKDVLEAVDTLPCVKYIASVAIKILEVIDEVQANKEACLSLATRAKEVALAVARACGDNGEADAGEKLQEDLLQLTTTMEEIMQFATSQTSRSKYKRFIYKSEDADTAKRLDVKLTQAFQLFSIQSNMSMRLSQRSMAQRIEEIQNLTLHSSTPPLITNYPLRIPEGIYLIRNVLSGKVLELENGIRSKGSVSVYTAPSRDGLDHSQIWSIMSNPHREYNYTIRNFAAGTVLDLTAYCTADGTQITCYPWNGGTNQTWEFYGSRTAGGIDLCTIRCCDPQTVLDSACTVNPNCEYLHATSLKTENSTREWSLVRFSTSHSLPRIPSSPLRSSQSLSPFPRRTFFLKNMLSGCFVTQPNASEGPNVVAQQLPLTAWYFIYNGDHGIGENLFALVSTSHQTTLDHFGGAFINSSKYNPWNGNHLWQPIPRDGFYILKNHQTGMLLYHDTEKGAIDTVESAAFHDPACHWKVVDSSGANFTSSDSTIIFDSMLSLLPPDPSSAPAADSSSSLTRSSGGTTPDHLQLRVQSADGVMQAHFLETLKQEQELLQEFVRSGYMTFVVVPQMISAHGGGSWRKVTAGPDDTRLFNGPTYQNSGRRTVCR